MARAGDVPGPFAMSGLLAAPLHASHVRYVIRLSLLSALLIVAAARCGQGGAALGTDPDPPPQTPPPTEPGPAPPSPGPTPPAPGPDLACGDYPHTRVVPVGSSVELTQALARAQPGDLLRLRDGVYTGGWTIAISGTPQLPITLCGTRQALLDAGSIDQRDVITLKASYWTLAGFSVTGGLRGIYTARASHNVLENLEIYGIGQEAVHWRVFSSHNVLRGSLIHDTGLVIAEFGEGVYIGQYRGHWCGTTGCQPDRSDSNQVIDNVIGPNVTAEHIDAKEGTTGGTIQGNRFDGNGLVQTRDWIDSWVEINGNGYTVRDNQGRVSPRDGFQVMVGLAGWGNDNVFAGNTADVRAGGFGFRVDAARTTGNRIACDNQVLAAAAGFSSPPCR